MKRISRFLKGMRRSVLVRRGMVTMLMVVLIVMLCAVPVFADTTGGGTGHCVQTSILGDGNEVCDDGTGSSVWDILRLITDIMSIGVGILGVIGISITGVQYLTAGGNEERAKKAKRRIYEIVIGIVAYAVMLGLLSWLMPGYNIESAPTVLTGSSGKTINGKGEFRNVGKNVVFIGENGKKVTGEKQIGGAQYYFDKTGVMQTGWVTITKNGRSKLYYYYEEGKKKGRKAFGNSEGVLKAYGPENGIGVKDTWYLNRKTGAVVGVNLAVPNFQQNGINCGPASLQFVRAYHIGKKDIRSGVAWNNQNVWYEMCGHGNRGYYPNGCVSTFGYKGLLKTINSYGGNVAEEKKAIETELLLGRPIILSAPGPIAYQHRYCASPSGGHFLVLKGFHNGQYFFSDPMNRIKVDSISTTTTVANSSPPASGWWFFRKVK